MRPSRTLTAMRTAWSWTKFGTFALAGVLVGAAMRSPSCRPLHLAPQSWTLETLDGAHFALPRGQATGIDVRRERKTRERLHRVQQPHRFVRGGRFEAKVLAIGDHAHGVRSAARRARVERSPGARTDDRLSHRLLDVGAAARRHGARDLANLALSPFQVR